MLELYWTNYTTPLARAINMLSELMTWVTARIAEDEYYKTLPFQGYMLLKDEQYLLTCIICTHGNTEKDKETQIEIMKLLANPPPKFEGKFIMKEIGPVETLMEPFNKPPVTEITQPQPKTPETTEDKTPHEDIDSNGDEDGGESNEEEKQDEKQEEKT